MRFVVVDGTGTIAADDLAAYAIAQQVQLREHYAKHYDGDGCMDEVRAGSVDVVVPTADEIVVHLEKNPPDDGTLGVHDTGTCHVYLDLAAKFGTSWTSVASHEVLEARADRYLHTCIELDDGSIIDYEICDRVEADTYGIPVPGQVGQAPAVLVELSNFNTPACFAPTGLPGEVFDHLGLSTKPNEVRPGGYAQQFDPARGWTSRGEMRGYRAHLAKLGLSRGARRKSKRLAHKTITTFGVTTTVTVRTELK